MFLLSQIGGTAGQIEQHGLYYFLGAAIVLLGGVITLILTGKLRFSRETEATEKQLEVSNALLASYNDAEVKKTREAMESIKSKLDDVVDSNEKISEENRALKEMMARLVERQEQYERYTYRNAGGGGNDVR